MKLLWRVLGKTKDLTYSLIEAITFHKGIKRIINGDEVIFPIRYSRYYPDGYEMAKQSFINAYCSGISLDLGAHIGLYTVIMAKKSERVLAFEPTMLTRAELRGVLELNGVTNVEIRSEAIAETSGHRNLMIRKDKISNANGFFIQGFGVETETISIDDLDLKIDFIKMDIEGAELEALRGATRVLRTLKAMTLEIHPRLISLQGNSTEEIWSLIVAGGGVIYLDSKKLSKHDFISRTDGFEIQVLFGIL